jgi:ABC-2 type transport system ATP-binding protein
VDLEVPEGLIYGFIGPNGAGKTTTIRILLGFLKPNAGIAKVWAWDCWKDSRAIKRQVGYLPGDLRLYSWFTVERALQIVSRIRGMNLIQAGYELSERFDMPIDLPVHRMSKGMRQKLGLLLALVHEPRLLILDEPTSGLDPPMRIALADCLRERAARGHTVFFSSHTLSEVEQLCDRVAIVRAGEIVADEALTVLRERARRVVQLWFDTSNDAPRIEPPGFLRVQKREENYWECELDQDTAPLITWASQQPLRDITIGPPDLESLFRRYYENVEEAP